MSRIGASVALLLALSATSFAAPANDAGSTDVRFEQRLGETLPLASHFANGNGTVAPLSTFLEGKPAVLMLGYAACRTLCSTVRRSLADSLEATGLAAGDRYVVIAASIDPDEPAADAAADANRSYPGHDATHAGWHFLTGDAGSIAALAQSIGFRYSYDRASHQYLHPAGIVVVTPTGRISRYFFGVEYPAGELRDALVEAGGNRISSPVRELLLRCFHFDPATGRYSTLVENSARALALVTLSALVALIWLVSRRAKSSSRGKM